MSSLTADKGGLFPGHRASDTVVAFVGASKLFGRDTLALDNVNWSISEGQRTCLLGPNGAGKSTSIRLLIGALQPTAGQVFLLGQDSTSAHYADAKRRTGIVPQNPGMYSDLNVQEYLKLARTLYGRGSVERTIEVFGLGEHRGLAGLNDPTRLFTLLILPLMMVVGGLATPAVLTIHTIVVERERRTLELLISLPVSIRDIIFSKLLAVLVLSCYVLLPLFAIDVAVGLGTGLLTAIESFLLLLVLLAAIACSGCFALVLALVARDFRTANNINGAMVGPIVLVSMVVLALVPGPMRLVALALLLATVGILCIVVAMKWFTFERYVG